MHWLCAGSVVYSPSLHSEHWLAPSREKVPAGHTSGYAVALWHECPAGHSTQAVRPGSAAKKPVAQAAHVVLDVALLYGEALPAAHGAGLLQPPLQK